MSVPPATIDVPLRTLQDGVIRIGITRVTLTTIVVRHNAGDTAEQIHSGFPTIPLVDIYAIITCYLRHRDEVDACLREQEAEAERIQREHEAANPPTLTREVLLARLENMR
ncbi:MAG TPA: DUF433 domain-containing protein [Oceanobacillus sp.]|nr:DUF433 domain-containing protein [Oceanobacillus sp.]